MDVCSELVGKYVQKLFVFLCLWSHIAQNIVIVSMYSVSQKKSPPEVSCHFFPNGWEFLDQILHTY